MAAQTTHSTRYNMDKLKALLHLTLLTLGEDTVSKIMIQYGQGFYTFQYTKLEDLGVKVTISYMSNSFSFIDKTLEGAKEKASSLIINL
jgi:hypothetical protein